MGSRTVHIHRKSVQGRSDVFLVRLCRGIAHKRRDLRWDKPGLGLFTTSSCINWKVYPAHALTCGRDPAFFLPTLICSTDSQFRLRSTKVPKRFQKSSKGVPNFGTRFQISKTSQTSSTKTETRGAGIQPLGAVGMQGQQPGHGASCMHYT